MTADDFESKTKDLLEAHGPTLLELAKQSIRHGLEDRTTLDIDIADYPDDLGRDGACFVTLKLGGNLRGCIGSPQAHQPLITDVAENAYSAAFRDPRFSALTENEFRDCELSISVLSPPVPMSFADEAD